MKHKYEGGNIPHCFIREILDLVDLWEKFRHRSLKPIKINNMSFERARRTESNDIKINKIRRLPPHGKTFSAENLWKG